ncbi:GntR family transcriptional regulator [Mariprofundus sp. EBB-1]|uniref:CvfB family protein n=1 Tax=Mariprofundus sp. EBB-1 TaxID=2650971 RepID=UPI000EF252C5|nr:S1-like domain-containing RNA-binding protein [Mariprofundus sp. EBB-1]RLL55595.1 GntR family transcriptional regulator [Mariprofundus sp. EBB-1]
MAEIGHKNRLRIIKKLDFGIYLDGGDLGEILMPIRYVPETCEIDDEVDVFVYRDSEDRLVATTEEPFAMVGEFALLKAVAVNNIGAFMQWGLMKDLLVPFPEQKPRMEEGKLYVVRIYIDEESQRIVGSARLDGFLHRESEDEFEVGESVNLFIANRTDLGYQVIVEHSHWGMLHNNEVPKGLKRGENVAGFIKNIRDDGRIDLCLHLRPSEKTDEISQIVIEKLTRNHGFLALTDKSSPEDIHATFGISKGMYKKAVGALYKKKLISLEKNGIQLLDK